MTLTLDELIAALVTLQELGYGDIKPYLDVESNGKNHPKVEVAAEVTKVELDCDDCPVIHGVVTLQLAP